MFNRIILALFLLASPQPQATTDAKLQPLAITNVTLIDATGRPAQSAMTVVVTNGRITAIAKSERIKIPPNAEAIDAKGKFLIPGLWDSHIHLTIAAGQDVTREMMAPALVAYGVTTVREMGGDWQRVQQLRKEISAGQVVGPRIFAPGPFVDGPQPPDVNFLPVGNEAEAREAVRKLKAQGVDFIKVQANLSPEAYRVTLDEAKKLSIPVAGHAPESVSALEVAQWGQRSIEHVSPVLPGDAGIMLACSSQESQLRAEMFELKRLAEDKNADRQQLPQRQRRLQRQMAETRDEKKCADLFRLFVKNSVHAVPTQIWSKRFAPLASDDLPENEALKSAPESLRTRWIAQRQQLIKASAAEDFAFRRLLFDKSRELVGLMHRARVPLLAGTDAMDGFVLPGLSLHEELALMVEAGLTPMEALQTATRNPAAFLGQSKSLGTIEKGKIADLVLLDADPLQNIAHTQKIHAVIIGGKLITQNQRQEMLAKIESFARQH